MNKAVTSRNRKRAQHIQMFLMLLPMLVLFFLFCAEAVKNLVSMENKIS